MTNKSGKTNVQAALHTVSHVVSNTLNNAVSSLWTSRSKSQPPTFTDKSILIAVMGMTGVGKTTLISKLTGLDMEVGHNLKACKYVIRAFAIH